MDAENIIEDGCSQRDSAEHKGHVRAHRSFNRIWKERDSAQPDLLGKILDKDNLNRAFKRVKANKGAPGVDGMTIDEAFKWLKEHNRELVDRIRRGKYTPQPVKRVEIPKPDGGVRKLGIPTVTDRIIQQAMAQQMIPIYEPLFADGSYGYRPGRSAKDAIMKVKEYAEQGYTHAVSLDLSKYFDTLNHEILVNLLRRDIKDERIIQMVKRYLKSGVMENGVVIDTEEGSPQGGNLSPLLANVYLNEFDREYLKRGVPCIRYADDISDEEVIKTHVEEYGRKELERAEMEFWRRYDPMERNDSAIYCSSVQLDEIEPVKPKVPFNEKNFDKSLYMNDGKADSAFREELWKMIREKDMDNSTVYTRANITRKAFSKILCGDTKVPQKRTVLSFCIGLQLNLEEAEELLASADMAFNPYDKRDKLVKQCILYEQYNIDEINDMLFACELPQLCTGF